MVHIVGEADAQWFIGEGSGTQSFTIGIADAQWFIVRMYSGLNERDLIQSGL